MVMLVNGKETLMEESLTSKQTSAELFAELLSRSKTYTLEILKRAGLFDWPFFYHRL